MRGKAGRFCLYEDGSQPVQFPGRYWYRLTVGGVHVKDWYVDLSNGDAALPEDGHTKAVLDEPKLTAPTLPEPVVVPASRFPIASYPRAHGVPRGPSA